MDTDPPAVDSLGKLVGVVSHDFNNRLTVINGYSDMLVCDLEGDARVKQPLKSGQPESALWSWHANSSHSAANR